MQSEYKEARLSVQNRAERTAAALSKLHCGLTLLGLTGVEDRLADNVPRTLAMLRTAGIKVREKWCFRKKYDEDSGTPNANKQQSTYVYTNVSGVFRFYTADL